MAVIQVKRGDIYYANPNVIDLRTANALFA